jgi:hypothetical protein
MGYTATLAWGPSRRMMMLMMLGFERPAVHIIPVHTCGCQRK